MSPPHPGNAAELPLPHRAVILAAIDHLCRQVLQGKCHTVHQAMIALLAGGHLLLEDMPGLGKTTLALALARTLGLSYGRVQCTSDLLPSDITGLSVYDRKESSFRFVPGPIFHQVVLVDEINRAMPKTQSALLEAMEEQQVTVEGKTYPLPHPFLVIATQNPVEMVGTYPLPESQLDRFLLTCGLGYPPAEVERAIFRHGSARADVQGLKAMLTAEQILAARASVREDVHLGEAVADYLYRLVDASRNHPLLLAGISTRGGISLADAARARAWLDGRRFVVPEDVQAVAVSVGAHRLLLREEGSARRQDLLRAMLQALPVPRG